jgi:hypothetical protein
MAMIFILRPLTSVLTIKNVSEGAAPFKVVIHEISFIFIPIGKSEGPNAVFSGSQKVPKFLVPFL